MTIVQKYPQAVNDSEFESLSSISEKDKIWDERKLYADTLSAVANSAGMERQSQRLAGCAGVLSFARSDDGIKLSNAHFCKYRHCPVCSWRRSLRNKAILLSALPTIEAQYPKHRWIFLTLTVRNVEVTQLRETLATMSKAWVRMLKRKDWPAVGWIRSLEITRGEDGSAHPHYHGMLMVPASYFSHGYITQKAWAEGWRTALRVDYDPVVDVRTIKPKPNADGRTALYHAVAEVAKYSTKSNDLTVDKDWFRIFAEQVKGSKMLTTGGALKGVMKRIDAETDDDLVHVEGSAEASTELQEHIFVSWVRKRKQYGRKKMKTD